MKKRVIGALLCASFVMSVSSCAWLEKYRKSTKKDELAILDIATGTGYKYEQADDYKTLANATYPVITVSEETEKQYPEFAEVLEEINETQKEEILDNFEELLGYAEETYEDYPDMFYGPYETSREVSVRRADSSVVSLLFEDYYYSGGAHPMFGYWGETYSTQTGEKLELSDVITDIDDIVEPVEDALDKYWSDAGLYDNIDIADVLADEESIAWTLDYNGITIYFNPYTIAPYVAGAQNVTLSFEEYPDIIDEEYIPEVESYGMEMSKGLPLYYDIDNDGEVDEVTVSAHMGRYDAIEKLIIDVNGDECREKIYAYEAKPTFIHMENGDNYLYFELSGDNDYRNTQCYRLSNEVEKIGDISSAMYVDYSDDGEYIATCYALTNPERFVMDTRTYLLSTTSGYKTYSVGESGMPESEDVMYKCDEEFMLEFTMLQDLEADIYNERTGKIKGKTTIEEDDTVEYYGTDDEKYGYLKLSDGTICRVEVDHDEYPQTIDGENIEEIFEGLLFAG